MSAPLWGALVEAVRRRLRWAWAWATAQWVAPAVAVGALIIVLSGRFVLWNTERVALALVALSAVLVLVAALALRVNTGIAARATDRGLAAADVFITAHELERKEAHGPFAERVSARAASLSRGRRARDALPLRTSGRRVLSSAMIGVLALGLAFAPNPKDEVRRRRAAEAAAVRAEAERVSADAAARRAKEKKRAVDRNDEAVQLTATLEALAADLQRIKTVKAAQEKLRQTEAGLRAGSEGDESLARRAAVRGLERSVRSKALEPGASGSASEQLSALADSLSALSAQQRKELADRLEALGATQQSGNRKAADALKKAAGALKAGDASAAAEGLKQAADAQQQAASSVGAESERQEAANQLADANQRLDDAGTSADAGDRATQAGKGEGSQSGPDGDGRGEEGSKGKGKAKGSSKASGQAKGAGDGEGGEITGGQPSGAVKGATGGKGSGQGGVGRPDGSADREAHSPTLASQARIFDPEAATGEQIRVRGKTDPSESRTVGRVDGPTKDGTVNVPLAQALPSYTERATQRLRSAEIPPSQRAVVQRYFDNLARATGAEPASADGSSDGATGDSATGDATNQRSARSTTGVK